NVKKGQLLVQLDDADARAAAARALAQVRAAQADLNAAKTGGTRQEVLTAQSQLVKAHTERDSAQRNLEAMKRLQQTGSASAAEVTEAEDRAKRAESEASALEQRLQGQGFSPPELDRVRAQAAQAQASY